MQKIYFCYQFFLHGYHDRNFCTDILIEFLDGIDPLPLGSNDGNGCDTYSCIGGSFMTHHMLSSAYKGLDLI